MKTNKQLRNTDEQTVRLETLLNLLKNSAENYEGQGKNTEVNLFISDVVNVCEMGIEIIDLIRGGINE